MKKLGYYSSGEFARMAGVTLRTIRYYDKQNILKPSLVTEAGARFYTDEDFARLQQILLLKYLGFSLDDIREMTVADSDYHFMLNSLKIQRKLVQDRIEQMQLVEQAIEDTTTAIREEHAVDWSRMLDLIHLTGMEKSFKNQYKSATNIAACPSEFMPFEGSNDKNLDILPAHPEGHELKREGFPRPGSPQDGHVRVFVDMRVEDVYNYKRFR